MSLILVCIPLFSGKTNIEIYIYTGSTGNNNVNLPAAIVVPIIIIVGVLLAVVASIAGWNVYHAQTRTPVIIKFSIKNEPGALARALKIFEVR